MSGKYVLDPDGTPRLEPDLLTWAHWFETAERHVAKTDLADGGLLVSTVFLGLDHSFNGGPPVLWETLVFANDHAPDNLRAIAQAHERRYTSRADALAGHAAIITEIQAAFDGEVAER